MHSLFEQTDVTAMDNRLCTSFAFVNGTASVQPIPTGPAGSRSSSLRCWRRVDRERHCVPDELGRSLHVLQLRAEHLS